MITKTESGLTQPQYEKLRDLYGLLGIGGDVSYQVMLEQYAPEFSLHDTVGGRSSTTCFDAAVSGTWLVRVAAGSFSDIGGGAISNIAVERLSSEDVGDQIWQTQYVSVSAFDASVPLSLGVTGNAIRVFWYDGTSIRYNESLDNGATWGAEQVVEALADVEALAATSTTQLHVRYTTTTKQNHRLAVIVDDGGWSRTDSHVRWPLPVGNMDAIALNTDTDIVVMAADLPPILGRQIISTTLAWKIERVCALVYFTYQNGRWSNHYTFDVVDRFSSRTRAYPALSSYGNFLFLTYLRTEGEYNEHTSTVTARSQDGLCWELPAPMSDDMDYKSILLKRGNHLYLLDSVHTQRSFSVAFNEELVSGETSEDVSDYVMQISSNIVQTRSTTVVLSNPDDVLRGAGHLLVDVRAMRARIWLGYDDSGTDITTQVVLAHLAQVERDRPVPVDHLILTLIDPLSLLGVISVEGAHEWPSQQIAGDNYHDPLASGYGGLGHTAVQAGGWESINDELRLRSNNTEGVTWSTHVSNMFCGSISTAFRMHYDDKNEYAGVVFWSADKNYLWNVVYHPDEDTLYLYERQEGTDTLRGSAAALGWSVDTFYWVRVEMNYAYITVYTSTDGVSWTSRITYERQALTTLDYMGIRGLPLTAGWVGDIAYGYTPAPSYSGPAPGTVVAPDGLELIIVGTFGSGVYVEEV